MGFGDVQVPGYKPPEVNVSAEVATETDLTYIAPPPGTPVPLKICQDRALLTPPWSDTLKTDTSPIESLSKAALSTYLPLPSPHI
jgi:hypothetical protein